MLLKIKHFLPEVYCVCLETRRVMSACFFYGYNSSTATAARVIVMHTTRRSAYLQLCVH